MGIGLDLLANKFREDLLNSKDGDVVEIPKGLGFGEAAQIQQEVALLKNGTTEAEMRKAMPVFSGFMKYFPDAMMYVSQVSKAGNDQHNPGKPLHWDRSKSGDELDALSRHLLEAGTVDTDGFLHDGKVAWRAMANLQKLLEQLKELEGV